MFQSATFHVSHPIPRQVGSSKGAGDAGDAGDGCGAFPKMEPGDLRSSDGCRVAAKMVMVNV